MYVPLRVTQEEQERRVRTKATVATDGLPIPALKPQWPHDPQSAPPQKSLSSWSAFCLELLSGYSPSQIAEQVGVPSSCQHQGGHREATVRAECGQTAEGVWTGCQGVGPGRVPFRERPDSAGTS